MYLPVSTFLHQNHVTKSVTSSRSVTSTVTNSYSASSGGFVRKGLGFAWSVLWPALKSLPVIAILTAMPLLLTQSCTKVRPAVCKITAYSCDFATPFTPMSVARPRLSHLFSK